MRDVFYATLAAAALCLTVACKQEVVPETPAEESTGKITVKASQIDTRTAVELIDAEKNKYGSKWTGDDFIYLLEVFDEVMNEGMSTPLTSDSYEASFDVSFDSYATTPTGSAKYVGIYSMGSEFNLLTSSDSYWEEVWGETPNSPRWAIEGRILDYQCLPDGSSFDPGVDLMFSKVKESTAGRPETIELAFARVGSIAKITLRGLPVGEKVISGRLSHDDDWVSNGFVYYDPLENEVAIKPNEDKMGNVLSYIDFYTLEDGPGIVVDNEGNADIWLRVLSGTISDHFSIMVKTVDDNENIKTFEKKVNLKEKGRRIAFTEGNITAFGVTLERQVISFAPETLLYFPDLDSDQRVIDFYDCYYDWGNLYYPFNYDSDFQWSIDIEYDSDVEPWLAFGTIKSSEYANLYTISTSDHERTATMVFTCIDDETKSFSVQVVEHNILSMQMNGETVTHGENLDLIIDTSPHFSAVVNIPPGMEYVTTNWYSGNNTLNLEPDSANPNQCIVYCNGYGSDWILIDLELFDKWYGTRHISTWVDVQVDDFNIPLYVDGDDEYDMYGRQMTVPFTGSCTFTADITVPESNIEFAYWFNLSDYQFNESTGRYEYVGDGNCLTLTPNQNTVVVTADGPGEDIVAYHVRLKDGKEDYVTWCRIAVPPISIKANDVELAGELRLTPNVPVTLTASLIGLDSQDIERAFWGLESGEWEKNEAGYSEYVEGTGDLNLTPDPNAPYTATLSTKEGVDIDEDWVYFSIKLSDDDSDYPYTYYYEIHVTIAGQTPSSAPAKAKKGHALQRHSQFTPMPSFGFKR